MPAFARYRLAEFAVVAQAEVIGRLAEQYARGGFAEQWTAATKAWGEQVEHLQAAVADLIRRRSAAADWHLLIESPMPRRGRRIDAVLLACDVIFVLEYKTGRTSLSAADRR